MASPNAGASALKYGDANTETTSPSEVKGLIIKIKKIINYLCKLIKYIKRINMKTRKTKKKKEKRKNCRKKREKALESSIKYTETKDKK